MRGRASLTGQPNARFSTQFGPVARAFFDAREKKFGTENYFFLKELCHGIFIHFPVLTKLFSH